jgi:hypothetical protein
MALFKTLEQGELLVDGEAHKKTGLMDLLPEDRMKILRHLLSLQRAPDYELMELAETGSRSSSTRWELVVYNALHQMTDQLHFSTLLDDPFMQVQ